MASTTAKQLTAEEYRRMGPLTDDSKAELVRGQPVKLCRPGFLHGLVQGRVYAILDRHVSSRKMGRVVVETGIITERDPDTVRGPDVSYWSAERLPLDQTPSGYPDLAVEVLSPGNQLARIRDKMMSAWCDCRSRGSHANRLPLAGRRTRFARLRTGASR